MTPWSYRKTLAMRQAGLSNALCLAPVETPVSRSSGILRLNVLDFVQLASITMLLK